MALFESAQNQPSATRGCQGHSSVLYTVSGFSICHIYMLWCLIRAGNEGAVRVWIGQGGLHILLQHNDLRVRTHGRTDMQKHVCYASYASDKETFVGSFDLYNDLFRLYGTVIDTTVQARQSNSNIRTWQQYFSECTLKREQKEQYFLECTLTMRTVFFQSALWNVNTENSIS